MRILGQRLDDGSVRVMETPDPVLQPGLVRVGTAFSAVSPGTEGGKVRTGRASLLGKARAKPEQARQALGMVRSIGLRKTVRKIRSKLEGAQPLGYSLSGRVMESAGAQGLRPGDLVACAGGGWANHADQCVVPRNLVVPVPEGVSPESAAFATLGSIAMQGVRLASPTTGECAAVVGLGIIGQLACQILRASGCRVLGLDVSEDAVSLALSSGSADSGCVIGRERPEAAAMSFSRGRGVDMVVICAGTSSSDPVVLAGRISRKKGRVVVVGAVGMDLPREDYYRKELAFSVSCSYGPGRYDPTYEEQGLDYPLPWVRWTEGRNMEAVLDLMAAGGVDPLAVTTHRVTLEEAPHVYGMVADGSEPYCGILIGYPGGPKPAGRIELPGASARTEGRVGLGMVGAGSFAQTFLLPPLAKSDRTDLRVICTASGLTATDSGERFGFARAVSDLDAVVEDPEVDAVVVASRHDSHGPAVRRALAAGRHVFVEKPLCIDREELAGIASLLAEGEPPLLMVGFNRRFSMSARAVAEHMSGAGPLVMDYRVNAGVIPAGHWIQDERVGGGRIVGEVCHFVDLMSFVCGAEPVSVRASCVGSEGVSGRREDDVLVQLGFGDGSVGSICYVASGSGKLPKERLEVHGGGRSAVLDDYRSVSLYGSGRTAGRRLPGKGHDEEVEAFLAAISSGEPPIPYGSLIATTLATFEARDSLADGMPRRVSPAALLTCTGD